MNVIITIQHPAHVHFYRHAIDELEADGHEVHVFAREKDLAVPLLRAYDIDHEVLVGSHDSIFDLALVQLTFEAKLLRRARALDPDVMTAIGGVAVSHVAPLVGARSVVFIDNEGAASHRITTPVADVVCTPRRFNDDYGDKHVRYDGYQELAYLHPDRFDPDPDRLRSYGIDPENRLFLLRFGRFGALHDVGEKGLSSDARRRLVSLLDEYGDVYVTSETELPPALQPYELPVPPTLVHELLAAADLYAGDSGTMATEAAVLGTPAVRCQSFTAFSNFHELEEYDLLRSTDDDEEAIELVRELAVDETVPTQWQNRRQRLLNEKIDVTGFITALLRKVGEELPVESEVRRPTVR